MLFDLFCSAAVYDRRKAMFGAHKDADTSGIGSIKVQ